MGFQRFLTSLKVQALDTMKKVMKMLELYQSIKDKLSVFNSQYAINLLDIIFENPFTTFKSIKLKIETNSYQTIYNLLDKFQKEDILIEITGKKRNKVFVFEELMEILK